MSTGAVGQSLGRGGWAISRVQGQQGGPAWGGGLPRSASSLPNPLALLKLTGRFVPWGTGVGRLSQVTGLDCSWAKQGAGPCSNQRCPPAWMGKQRFWFAGPSADSCNTAPHPGRCRQTGARTGMETAITPCISARAMTLALVEKKTKTTALPSIQGPVFRHGLREQASARVVKVGSLVALKFPFFLQCKSPVKVIETVRENRCLCSVRVGLPTRMWTQARWFS